MHAEMVATGEWKDGVSGVEGEEVGKVESKIEISPILNTNINGSSPIPPLVQPDNILITNKYAVHKDVQVHIQLTHLKDSFYLYVGLKGSAGSMDNLVNAIQTPYRYIFFQLIMSLISY